MHVWCVVFLSRRCGIEQPMCCVSRVRVFVLEMRMDDEDTLSFRGNEDCLRRSIIHCLKSLTSPSLNTQVVGPLQNVSNRKEMRSGVEELWLWLQSASKRVHLNPYGSHHFSSSSSFFLSHVDPAVPATVFCEMASRVGEGCRGVGGRGACSVLRLHGWGGSAGLLSGLDTLGGFCGLPDVRPLLHGVLECLGLLFVHLNVVHLLVRCDRGGRGLGEEHGRERERWKWC